MESNKYTLVANSSSILDTFQSQKITFIHEITDICKLWHFIEGENQNR